MNSDTFSQNESASQSEDRRAGKYELLKRWWTRFAQEELTYLNRLDITKENTLCTWSSRCDRAICLLIPVKSGSKWRISLWYFNQSSIYANMRGLEKEVSFNPLCNWRRLLTLESVASFRWISEGVIFYFFTEKINYEQVNRI
jgi:hypothetical protein